MTHRLSKLALAALFTAGLSACGSNNGGGGSDQPPPGSVTPPPVATPTLAERFSAGFAAIFNQDRNSEPRDPKPEDVVAVNLTAEPIDF